MVKVLKGLGRARINSSEGDVGKERLFLSILDRKSKNSRYGAVKFSRKKWESAGTLIKRKR